VQHRDPTLECPLRGGTTGIHKIDLAELVRCLELSVPDARQAKQESHQQGWDTGVRVHRSLLSGCQFLMATSLEPKATLQARL
jgi:hypothetical protein